MGRLALIFAASLVVTLGSCATTPHVVFQDRVVEVVKPVATPCVKAGDRRPPPAPLADTAMPSSAKQLVATLIAHIKELTAWVTVADHQLDACTGD